MAIGDKFVNVGEPGSATYLGTPGYSMGGATINIQTYTGWPTGKVIFDMYTIELVGTIEKAKQNTRTYWQGIHNGSGVISSLQRLGGTDQNYTAGTSTRVIITHSAHQMNQLIDGLSNQHNRLDGSHKGITTDTLTATGAVTASSFIVSGNQTTAGWSPLGVAVSSVASNGNRSYDVTFASSVAAILSPGMRALFDKTVAGNAYMAGLFNGTSQYFTKVSPTGALGTVTDNFTIITVIQPTSYAVGYIASRCDASGNNLLGLQMTATGQIVVAVLNGGAANYRVVVTLASVPLFKKTHINATWASGAVKVYFDGVEVPTTAGTGGTAPTTAGTGGDFSLGRQGASSVNYFPGYISNVAIFNTVLSSATAKQYSTYKLTGSEPNCIGAWSLDNTANDQSSLGNNLTATGGVGYTAMSPHGQLGNGVSASQAVGLCMAVNGSTATFQLPEGCTLPTTGGISNVSYATSGNPYNWVPDKGRWELQAQFNSAVSQNEATANVWYQMMSASILKFMTGKWQYGMRGSFSQESSASGTQTGFIVLSPTAPTNTVIMPMVRMASAVSQGWMMVSGTWSDSVNITSPTDYSLYCMSDTILTGSMSRIRGDQGITTIFAMPDGV